MSEYQEVCFSENIGSIYRSSDNHIVKFTVSWITFIYNWICFDREKVLSSSGKVEVLLFGLSVYPFV